MAARDLVIGGLHAVRLALARAPGDALELWLRREPHGAALEAIEQAARAAGVAVQRVEVPTLDRVYGDTHHQGAVLRRRSPAGHALHSVLESLDATAAVALVLVLDSVHDPRNFGACLRVADGAGANAVVYPRDRSAPLGNATAKTASGALDTVALVPVPNLARALDELREAGVWVTGTEHAAPRTLYQIDFTQPSALVLGNEGAGLRRLTRARCDRLARIPMCGELPSLNVASAAAVGLYEARRQRLATR